MYGSPRTRIDDAARFASLRALRGMVPTLRFKLDPVPTWNGELLAEPASLDGVDVVDVKGLYRNATVAMEPELDLYRRVFEALPEAWIEDPALTDDTAELLDPHRERITWDVPIASVGDIGALPWPPRHLNLRPARFGSVRRLFDTYDCCEAQALDAEEVRGRRAVLQAAHRHTARISFLTRDRARSSCARRASASGRVWIRPADSSWPSATIANSRKPRGSCDRANASEPCG